MARAKSRPLQQEKRRFFTFPNLHLDIARAVSPAICTTYFREATEADDDAESDSEEEHSTFVMGRFLCTNKACKTDAWTSKKVTIVIRGYEGNGYSALVYNQRCRVCNNLGTFHMDNDSYVERVSYRLRKWAGVATAPPPYTVKVGPEHEWKFCEGCKRGVCRQNNDFVFY